MTEVHHATRKSVDMDLAKKQISPESHAAVHEGRLTLAEARELGRNAGPDAPPKPESRISKDEQGQPCWCNCGEWTKPGRRFLPGHDQRTKGLIKRAVRAGEVEKLTDRQKEYAAERNLIEETEQQMAAEESSARLRRRGRRPRSSVSARARQKPRRRPPASSGFGARSLASPPHEYSGKDTSMRAILYCRVSTAEQVEHGYSLQQQTDRLRAHCAEHGIEVAGVAEDAGVSGAVLERPGLMEALQTVADGHADTILAQDVDRVSRDPWHFGYLQIKLAEYGGTLRTLDDSGDGSPEGAFFRDIRRSMAKMEKGITRRRTQRGREQRAREGKVVGAASAPLGFAFNDGRDTLVVDLETVPLVRRIFRLVAEESYGLSTVAKTFEREGIATPKGKKLWARPIIKDISQSDVYKPHNREDLDALVERGVLSGEVAAKAPVPCGIWWYGRAKTVRTGKLTKSGGPARRFESREPDEMIAVPVADAGVPLEHVERARSSLKGNRAPSNAGRRYWTLSGGIARCACGRYLVAFSNNKGGAHYLCGHRRRHGAGSCEHEKFHHAANLEERVRAFVERLLLDPETLREQVVDSLERERRAVGPVEEEVAHLRGELESLVEERDGYLRQNARSRLSDEDLDRFLADTDARRRELEEALDGLAGRLESAGEVERNLALLDEYLADLPHLLNLTAYKPAESTEDVPEPYLLTPDTAPQPRPVDWREMAARWRRVYEMLDLHVTAYRDGTLILEWAAGRRTLAPGEPQESSGTDSPETALSLSSDSQRYRHARVRWGRQGSARARSSADSGIAERP